MEYKDYYKILGLKRDANESEIKHAYRRLARKFHPDVSKESNAEEQFKNIQEAYEVLKDPKKRKAYDELGSNWKAGQDFRPPPHWQHTESSGGEPFFTSEEMGGDFSDFFAHLFGGASGFNVRRDAPRKGRDQQAQINITLEEAFEGASKTFQLQMPHLDANGQIGHSIRNIKVNIPKGVQQGQQLRLQGQGLPGSKGLNGDLYLTIHILPHPLYSLSNQDVYLTVPVTPWEAALGGKITVPTLGGSVDLTLKALSHSGQKLRLKGRGMPGKSSTGDQYILLRIDIPMPTTEEQKDLYKTMARLMPFNPRKDLKQ